MRSRYGGKTRLGFMTLGVLAAMLATPEPRASAAIPGRRTLEKLSVELTSMTVDGVDGDVTATKATLVAGYTLRLEGTTMSEEYDDGQ